MLIYPQINAGNVSTWTTRTTQTIIKMIKFNFQKYSSYLLFYITVYYSPGT